MASNSGLGLRTFRGAALIPQTAQTPYFTVVGGKVRILEIIGEVVVIIGDVATNAKLIANPTVGADVDLCAQANIQADAAGTIYSITGTLTDALIPTTSGAVTAQANGITVAAGTIDLYTDANSVTGTTKWMVRWIPVDSGAKVVVA